MERTMVIGFTKENGDDADNISLYTSGDATFKNGSPQEIYTIVAMAITDIPEAKYIPSRLIFDDSLDIT